jgi:hypothetical protein
MAEPTAITVEVTLGGVTHDISADVLGFTTDSGRKSASDLLSGGQANVTIQDLDRTYDPLNRLSARYGDVFVGGSLHVTVENDSDFWYWSGRITSVKHKAWGQDSLPVTEFVASDWVASMVAPQTMSVSSTMLKTIDVAGGRGQFFTFSPDRISTTNGTVKDWVGGNDGYCETRPAGGGVSYTLTSNADNLGVDMNEKGGRIAITDLDVGKWQATGPNPSHEWNEDWIRGGMSAFAEISLSSTFALSGSYPRRYWALLAFHNYGYSDDKERLHWYVYSERSGSAGAYYDDPSDSMFMGNSYMIMNVPSKVETASMGTLSEFEGVRRSFVLGIDRDTVTLRACVSKGAGGTIGGGTSQSFGETFAVDRGAFAPWPAANLVDGYGDIDRVAMSAYGDGNFVEGNIYGSPLVPYYGYPNLNVCTWYAAGLARTDGDAGWASMMDSSARLRGLNGPDVGARLLSSLAGLDAWFPSGWSDIDSTTSVVYQEDWKDPNQNVLAGVRDLVSTMGGRMRASTQIADRVHFEDFAAAQGNAWVRRMLVTDQLRTYDSNLIRSSSGSPSVNGKATVNWVEVDSGSGFQSQSDDAVSVAAHGVQAARFQLPFGSAAEAGAFTEFYVARHKDQRVVVSPVEFSFPSGDAWSKLARLEIGHRVGVERQPGGVGSVTAVDQVVEGIQTVYEATHGTWKWTLHFGSYEPWRTNLSYSSSDVSPGVASHTMGTGEDTITLGKPEGVQVGDILLAVLGDDSTHGTADSWATPAGWTADDTVGTDVGDCHLQVFRRLADGTEADSQTFTHNYPGSNTASCGAYLRVPRLSTDALEFLESSEVAGQYGPVTVPGLTTTSTYNIVLAAAVARHPSPEGMAWSGAGWVEGVDQWGDMIAAPVGNCSLSWAVKRQDVAGATGDTACATGEGSTVGWAGAQWALK